MYKIHAVFMYEKVKHLPFYIIDTYVTEDHFHPLNLNIDIINETNNDIRITSHFMNLPQHCLIDT